MATTSLLTSDGGQFELPKSVREYIALTEDGVVYVSKSHVFDPHVASFIARLEQLNVKYERKIVDMTMIAKLYDSSQHEISTDSSMQRDALKLFEQAADAGASDIHIRVEKEKTAILFRIHNELNFIKEDRSDYGMQLCSSIYSSMTQISDSTYQPNARQDARISNKRFMPDNIDGMRIGTSPQVDGHIMVIRLLYNSSDNDYSLTKIGFSKIQSDVLTLLRKLPTGINLVSGPTGSGKSTTLQRVLGAINQEHQGRKHIITIEDPPEYPIDGAIQTPVTNAETEEQRSIEFQKAIKASLRLDPDIIMIGEMRDPPSAKLAIEAAMTGHQVWSTIHTNSALAVLDRLIDMGVPPSLVYDHTIISGLVCQRLLKTVCPHCCVKLDDAKERFNPRDIDRISSVVATSKVNIQGEGCEQCRGTGTGGRIAVVEAIKTDAKLMDLFLRGDKLAALNYWQHDQDGRTILDSAIEKVAEGIVDPFIAEDTVGPLIMGIIEQDHGITNLELQSAI